jgi:hypothetical protein
LNQITCHLANWTIWTHKSNRLPTHLPTLQLSRPKLWNHIRLGCMKTDSNFDIKQQKLGLSQCQWQNRKNQRDDWLHCCMLEKTRQMKCAQSLRNHTKLLSIPSQSRPPTLTTSLLPSPVARLLHFLFRKCHDSHLPTPRPPTKPTGCIAVW